MLDAFSAVPLVAEVVAVLFSISSPMLPAVGLSFVVVPTIPAVLEGVIAPVAVSVVNLPARGVVKPIVALLTVPPGIVTVPVNVGDANGA